MAFREICRGRIQSGLCRNHVRLSKFDLQLIDGVVLRQRRFCFPRASSSASRTAVLLRGYIEWGRGLRAGSQAHLFASATFASANSISRSAQFDVQLVGLRSVRPMVVSASRRSALAVSTALFLDSISSLSGSPVSDARVFQRILQPGLGQSNVLLLRFVFDRGWARPVRSFRSSSSDLRVALATASASTLLLISYSVDPDSGGHLPGSRPGPGAAFSSEVFRPGHRDTRLSDFFRPLRLRPFRVQQRVQPPPHRHLRIRPLMHVRDGPGSRLPQSTRMFAGVEHRPSGHNGLVSTGSLDRPFEHAAFGPGPSTP